MNLIVLLSSFVLIFSSYTLPTYVGSQINNEADAALWQREIKILSDKPNLNWWITGYTGNHTSNDWITTADILLKGINQKPELKEYFIDIFGNPYNNTIFIALTSIDDVIIKNIQSITTIPKGIFIKYIKGVAPKYKLELWASKLNPEELEKRGLPIISMGISVNGTLLLMLEDVTATYIEILKDIINNNIPPGVLVVGKGEPLETEIRPLKGGVEVWTEISVNTFTQSTLGFIVKSGSQKYAIVAGHAVMNNGRCYQPTYGGNNLIGYANNPIYSGRRSDSAIVPLLYGVDGVNQIYIDELQSIIVYGQINYPNQYVGQFILKKGISTGVTGGYILAKWIWTQNPTYGLLYYQIAASYPSAPGDSGGPVYAYVNGIAYAMGIHWGRDGLTNYAVYSPPDGIEYDFGIDFQFNFS